MSDVIPDHPSGAALLEVGRRALLDEIAPALSGKQRYVVLMVANAIGIVMREMDAADATAEAWDRALASVPAGSDDPLKALVSAIRNGRHDADAALHEALTATTEIAAGIWKPSRAPEAKRDPKPSEAEAA